MITLPPLSNKVIPSMGGLVQCRLQEGAAQKIEKKLLTDEEKLIYNLKRVASLAK